MGGETLTKHTAVFCVKSRIKDLITKLQIKSPESLFPVFYDFMVLIVAGVKTPQHMKNTGGGCF